MKYKLMDLCNGITDGSHNPPTGGEKSDYLMISSKNVFDDQITLDDPRFLSREQFEQEDKRTRIKPGDVLMTIVGTVGRTAVVSRDIGNITLQRSVAVLHVNEEICYSRYLMYLLRSKKQLFDSEAHGVAQKGIYLKQLSNTYIDIPDRLKQLEVINILDRVQYLINERTVELSKLENLIKARFVEMFGDESNPFQWPIINVEDVANVSVGVVIKPAQYYTDAEHGVKAFRSLNIGPMTIKDGDWVYFSYEGNDKNVKSQLKENDLLIVRSGAPGTACVVPKQYEGCNAIDIIIARPDTIKINPYYLCTYTNMPHGKRQIEEGTGGAAQQHFNVGKYNKLRLMSPPLELQNEFVNFMSQVDKSKVVVQKALNEAQLLFDSLMQQYFG